MELRKIRIKSLVCGVLILAFAVQVGIATYDSVNAREFTGVRLSETNYSEVYFRNEAQGIDLAGMLFLPAGEGPYPGAIIIHGSGPSTRANGWYLTLTKFLQDNGIAVLLPDRRGSEKSDGSWQSADYGDLATDTLAAIEFLRHASGLNLNEIGIIGMSQGGKYAPLVASQTDDLDFVVNVVGSAVLGKEQLLYEENYNLQQMGIPPGISYLVALLSTAHIRYIRQPEFWQAVSEFDPIAYWRQIEQRSLVLYGENDTNIPTRESVERLQALNNPNVTITVFEESGHALEDPPAAGNSIFRADALQEISNFILASGN